MADSPVPAPQPGCLDSSSPITPWQSATIRYIVIGAITALVGFSFAVLGKTPNTGYVKDVADNGADLVLYGIQFWLYYRAYKARVNATKTISTTAPVAATVENPK